MFNVIVEEVDEVDIKEKDVGDMDATVSKKSRVEKEEKSKNRWGNKKVRKFGGDFYLSINYQFVEDLKKCREYHTQTRPKKVAPDSLATALGSGSGTATTDAAAAAEAESSGATADPDNTTWLNEKLIELLCELYGSTLAPDYDGPLEFLTFELWERSESSGGTVDVEKGPVAASFGYAINGRVFNDYTFMTLCRDRRSVGSILTRVVADILEQCDFLLWYILYLLFDFSFVFYHRFG